MNTIRSLLARREALLVLACLVLLLAITMRFPAFSTPSNLAGVFNDTKTVLGLMPHPENAVEPMFGGTDGKALFEGMVEALS